MFEIYGGREKFTQWTKDQKMIMDRLPVGAEILFYSDPSVDDPLITEVYEMRDANDNVVNVCNVPNILLTEAKRFKVKIPVVVIGSYGKAHKYVGQREKYFDVEAAEKPNDYVYEETETEGFSATISDAQIEQAVKKYLEENGTDGIISEGDVATDDEVDDIINDIFGA